MTIKDILLRKLDSILNPNFVNKFIFSIFSLGAICISYQKFMNLFLSIEIITSEFYSKFTFENDLNISFENLTEDLNIIKNLNINIVIFGFFLITISIYLYLIKKDILENSDKKKIDNILNILNTSKNHIDISNTDEEIRIFLLRNENLIHKT